jgi:mannosyltransferase
MRFDRERGDLTAFDAKSAALSRSLRLVPSRFALAAGLASVALILRLHGLADKSFWYDELFTWGRARLPLAQLAVDAFKHKQLPTYFLLVSPLASSANPEWTLRLPSAIFGAICVFLVAGAASELRGLVAGLVAGLLMALSPTEVQFAQEARPYVLGSALVLAALWGLLRIANRSASGPIPQESALPGAWTAYTLGTLGALCIENNTFPWLFASNLALLVVVLRAPSSRKGGLLINWARSQGVILGVWLPALAVTAFLNRGAELEALLWVPKPTWEMLRSTVATVYLFRISDLMTFRLMPTLVSGFGAVVALIALLGAWRLRRDPPLLAALGLALVAMPLTILLLSAVQPLLVPRYLLWSTGPFFVLAGIGAASLPARISAPTALLLAAGGALSLAPYYKAETKPLWRDAAAYLATHVRPQDAVVAENSSVRFVLTAYAQRFPLHSHGPILSWSPIDTARQAAAAERVWAVYGRVGQGIQEPEELFREKWAAFGTPAEQIGFGASILVLRFDRPSQHDIEGSSEEGDANRNPGHRNLSGELRHEP